MISNDFTVAIFANYCLSNIVNITQWLTTSNV